MNLIAHVEIPVRDLDLDAALTRATTLGSTILFPKTAVGETTYVAEITDPEGNRLALQTL